MGAGIILLAGVATFFNIAIIYWKWGRGQQQNAIIDGIILAGVMYVFSGTLGALAIGTIASSLFSVFLIAKPPREGIFDDW